MIKEIYYRWQARRELKKAVKVMEKICDELPASAFKGLMRDKDGRELDHIEVRNSLMLAVSRMKAEL